MKIQRVSIAATIKTRVFNTSSANDLSLVKMSPNTDYVA